MAARRGSDTSCGWSSPAFEIHRQMTSLALLFNRSMVPLSMGKRKCWRADTRDNAEQSLDLFTQTYKPKYPKATLWLQKIARS